MNLECPDHDIKFNSYAHYTYHMENECEKMLLDRNICVYRDERGERCKKSFYTKTALLWHCGTRHNQHPCAKCGIVFSDLNELEAHEHVERPKCENHSS